MLHCDRFSCYLTRLTYSRVRRSLRVCDGNWRIETQTMMQALVWMLNAPCADTAYLWLETAFASCTDSRCNTSVHTKETFILAHPAVPGPYNQVTHLSGRRPLRSAGINSLAVPPVKLTIIAVAYRFFPVVVCPPMWNDLPDDVKYLPLVVRNSYFREKNFFWLFSRLNFIQSAPMESHVGLRLFGLHCEFWLKIRIIRVLVLFSVGNPAWLVTF